MCPICTLEEIAYDAPEAVVLWPCGHVLCKDCYPKLQAPHCPMCRAVIMPPNVRDAYMSLHDEADNALAQRDEAAVDTLIRDGHDLVVVAHAAGRNHGLPTLSWVAPKVSDLGRIVTLLIQVDGYGNMCDDAIRSFASLGARVPWQDAVGMVRDEVRRAHEDDADAVLRQFAVAVSTGLVVMEQ